VRDGLERDLAGNIDLNCDMGESFGAWKIGADAEIMPFITSANIACGAHAGDPNVMWATVALAKVRAVAVGAHPGFPDLQGFGRRALHLSPDEVRNMLLTQLGALWAIARAQGVDLHHVKPHGALYNMACADASLAREVVAASQVFSATLPIYCLPDSMLQQEAEMAGVKAIPEGFVDRAYQPNGSLADRKLPGSVQSDPAKAASQALQLAGGSVMCLDGSIRQLHVLTLCIHGDTPGAASIAAEVRTQLEVAGYNISSSLDG